jgi:ABC-2 type transport system permease protein
MLTGVLAIVRANAKRLQGERRLPFFVVLLPILIMFFVGGIFGVGGKKLVVGVVAPKSDALAQDLVHALDRSDRVKPRRFASADGARRAVRRGRVSASMIVPRGYGDAIRRGEVGDITFVVQPGRTESAQARLVVAAVLARANLDVVTARAIQQAEGVPAGAALTRAKAATAEFPDFLRSEKRPESPFAYTAPSNLVLFAFITGLVTASTVVVSRRIGVTRRILASPTSAGAVVIAEMIGAFLVALFQASLMLAVGGVLFGVAWGPPLAVMALLVSLALVCAGAGLVLATIVRTPEQAISIGPPIGIALGMLGGCMWPLEGVGPVMRLAGHVAPQAWAMDAFIRLVFDHRGFGGIAGEVGVLLLYAVALLALATTRLRRSVLLS